MAPHHVACALIVLSITTVCFAAQQDKHSTCTHPYKPKYVSVVLQDGLIVPIEQPQVNGAVAHASFIDSDQTISNFGQLHVETQSAFSDDIQMYAAGWAEGWLTAHRINQQVQNTMHYFKTSLGLHDDQPVDWLEEQDAYVRHQVDNNPHDPFWRALGLVLRQFDGLVEGYRARAATATTVTNAATANATTAGQILGGELYGNLTKRDLLFMNGNGELYDVLAKPRNTTTKTPTTTTTTTKEGSNDNQQQNNDTDQQSNDNNQQGNVHQQNNDIQVGFNPATADSYTDPSLGPQELFMRIAGSGRCSALVKVASDLSNIFMAHSTWDTFTAMLRIYKHYKFNLHDEAVQAKHIAFSSYPGELFSDDDFYMMAETNIVVLQTTNHIFNNSILNTLTPHSAVSWQRVRVANMLATNGSAWADLLARENSGTYNNQYMVVDLKRFVPHKELQDDLLWVVEQIPNKVTAADLTHALWLGYWPSFNVPYFSDIYAASAYPDFRNATHHRGNGTTEYDMPVNWLSPVISPRAMIFRRDQGGVSSVEELKELMRYNDYQHDKLSDGHPLASICGRGDLEDEYGFPTGCYDTKVTDYHMARNMEAEAVNGPTRSHGIKAFSWSDWSSTKYQHKGHPEVFNFEFERIGPHTAACAHPGVEHAFA